MPALEDLFITKIVDEDDQVRAFNIIEDQDSGCFWAYGHVPENQFIIDLNAYIYVNSDEVVDWKWPPVDYVWATWDESNPDEPFTAFKISETESDGYSPVTRMMV